MAGSDNAIGRDLRKEPARSAEAPSSAQHVSPPFAASTIFLRMSSPASSAILSSAKVALFRLPAGRPGPPGLPGSKGGPASSSRLFIEC